MPSKIPIEEEYDFVLNCLQSSLDNAGKIDYKAIASKYNTTIHGAQQRVRRCQKSANLGGHSRSDLATGSANTSELDPEQVVEEARLPKSKSQGMKKKRKFDAMTEPAEDDHEQGDDWSDDIAFKVEVGRRRREREV